MMKLLLLASPLLASSSLHEPTNYDTVSDGLVFEYTPHQPEADRRTLRRADEPLRFTRKLRRVQSPADNKKESFRDSTAKSLSPTAARNLQQQCASSERYLSIDLTTDNYGFENRWTLKTSAGEMVMKGPPDDTNYADNTRYLGGFCVGPGDYVFTVYDKFKDGMCCGTGAGSYAVQLDGAEMFASPTGDEDWETREHYFTVEGPEEADPEDWDWDADYEDPGDYDETFDEFDDLGGLATERGRGFGGCQNLKIQFKIDKYGKETTVTAKKQGSSRAVMSSVKNVGAYQTKTLQKCVPAGTYTVTFKDNDGICCKNGKGWYKISIRGSEVVNGGYFVGSKSHTVKVGYNYQKGMSARDKQYLAGHNSRRRSYHRKAGKAYRPLRWSPSLASAASGYARKLLASCSQYSIKHAHGIDDGENLAKNRGKGQWGSLYPVNNIVSRWVEREAGWKYPKNAHLTQAIWRSTSYLGCGESVKKMSNGDTCRMQVCRYTRAGNCNVRNNNWRAEAFKDDTGCGRPCPSEGCYA